MMQRINAELNFLFIFITLSVEQLLDSYQKTIISTNISVNSGLILIIIGC